MTVTLGRMQSSSQGILQHATLVSTMALKRRRLLDQHEKLLLTLVGCGREEERRVRALFVALAIGSEELRTSSGLGGVALGATGRERRGAVSKCTRCCS